MPSDLERAAQGIGSLLAMPVVLSAQLVRSVAGSTPGAVKRLARAESKEALAAADRIGTALLQRVIAGVVARIDLTALVRDNVDVNALVENVDVNTIVERVDLLGLAEFVINGVDLPQVIRMSTEGVTSGAVHGARMKGHDADEAVARFVDRMLFRRPTRHPGSPNGVAAEHAEEELP